MACRYCHQENWHKLTCQLGGAVLYEDCEPEAKRRIDTIASTHTSMIELSDGRTVCQSYGTTVAAFLPGKGWFRTDARYSVTTSRHMNQFAGEDAPIMAHADLLAATAPVESRL